MLAPAVKNLHKIANISSRVAQKLVRDLTANGTLRTMLSATGVASIDAFRL
jgi:hypothetical protein